VPRAIIAIGLAILSVAVLRAHDRKAAGPFVLTIGWGDEPALAGVRNFVDVAVADAAGAPVASPDTSLVVEVSFGGNRTTLPLAGRAQQPGRFRAPIIPSRAGTYSFHISGTIRHQAIDVTSTCSDKTFECVADTADLQFPAKDPSAGQLAERLERALPRADEATRRAARAEWIAMGAIVLAAGALAFAVIRARP
jgi:hypothetical protein